MCGARDFSDEAHITSISTVLLPFHASDHTSHGCLPGTRENLLNSPSPTDVLPGQEIDTPNLRGGSG